MALARASEIRHAEAVEFRFREVQGSRGLHIEPTKLEKRPKCQALQPKASSRLRFETSGEGIGHPSKKMCNPETFLFKACHLNPPQTPKGIVATL